MRGTTFTRRLIETRFPIRPFGNIDQTVSGDFLKYTSEPSFKWDLILDVSRDIVFVASFEMSNKIRPKSLSYGMILGTYSDGY